MFASPAPNTGLTWIFYALESVVMDWRINQSESRARYLAKYNTDEVEHYESWILQLTRDDDLACLRDIQNAFTFRGGMSVLDVGAGTGAMCKVLLNVPGLSMTAMEPAPAMLAKLKAKPELRGIRTVEGFCDSEDDRRHFPAASFDVVISRQLVNGLFDPISAFNNWHHWLRMGGSVIVLDGFYDRSSWTGKWEEEIDVLPVSACRTTALIPYLLEFVRFHVDVVTLMQETNGMPSTRTQRYLVVASKHAEHIQD